MRRKRIHFRYSGADIARLSRGPQGLPLQPIVHERASARGNNRARLSRAFPKRAALRELLDALLDAASSAFDIPAPAIRRIPGVKASHFQVI
jgi:hypothetical protein